MSPAPLWRPAGTWHGSAHDLGPASEYDGATLAVQFYDDGSWKAVERQGARSREFVGTSSIRGNDVWLADPTGHHLFRPTRWGNRLYFYGRYPFRDRESLGNVAIQLRRQE